MLVLTEIIILACSWTTMIQNTATFRWLFCATHLHQGKNGSTGSS